MIRKVYVASSWRNRRQPAVVNAIRRAGHRVFDFRNPVLDDPSTKGFHWSEIDTEWELWTPAEYLEGLQHPIAVAGYVRDFEAMRWADTFVLVQPCGRSAHLELGWAVGAGKRTAILLEVGQEPELMVKMVDALCATEEDMLRWLEVQT